MRLNDGVEVTDSVFTGGRSMRIDSINKRLDFRYWLKSNNLTFGNSFAQYSTHTKSFLYRKSERLSRR